jgi:hypothetical protein
MILTPHLLIGAAIGAKTHNLGLIIILGLLSHLILDRIPHWDYPNTGISNFKKTKDLKRFIFDLLKIVIDGVVGIIIVFLLVRKTDLRLDIRNLIFILLGIIFATLPDIFLFFSFTVLSPEISRKIINFHNKFFHCKKEGHRITFLNLTTEIIVIFLAILVFFS